MQERQGLTPVAGIQSPRSRSRLRETVDPRPRLPTPTLPGAFTEIPRQHARASRFHSSNVSFRATQIPKLVSQKQAKLMSGSELPDVVQPALSPRRAFVVQFRVKTDAQPEIFTGRVEHMITSQSAHFSAPEELLAFLRRVLTEES